MNITDYWTKFFEIESKAFNEPCFHIVPHSSLDGYWGVWIFMRNETVIVSSPNSFLPTCKELIAEVSPTTLCDTEVVAMCFQPHFERIIGPVYHGSLETEDFMPIPTSDGREISFDQASAVNDGSDPTGWDWSGCGKVKEHYFGIFKDGTLTAVSNYSINNDVVAFPGIFTHPNFRGRGLAKLALTLAFQHSLNAGLLMEYQTLYSNVGAIKAAESLGVKEFARHVALRLREKDNHAVERK